MPRHRGTAVEKAVYLCPKIFFHEDTGSFQHPDNRIGEVNLFSSTGQISSTQITWGCQLVVKCPGRGFGNGGLRRERHHGIASVATGAAVYGFAAVKGNCFRMAAMR